MNFEIEGCSYFAETCGEGFPLVCLHGFTGGASTWKPFCDLWGHHSKLILPDIIGHGLSDSPESLEAYNIETAAGALYRLLGELGVEKTDLLGYSMGGRLAITFAVKYPEKVRKLILESTTAGLGSEEEKQERRQKDEALAAMIGHKGVEAFVDYWEQIPLFKSQMNLPDSKRELIRKQRLMNNPAGLSNSLRGMGTGSQPSWWDHIKSFEFETLLLTGTLDEKFCRIANEMGRLIPNSQITQIHGAGHALHVEQPEKFGTIVSEFLSNT